VTKYMLDTCIVIYAMNNRPAHVAAKLAAHESETCISAITFAELIYGAENAQNPAKTLAKLKDFCSNLDILPYCENAAAHYGAVKAKLRQSGQIIGENDMHIAGHARSAGLVVVTNNTKHFERIPGLMVEDWG
jgi:tRNA(fMet)-specific endonuclease VapC